MNDDISFIPEQQEGKALDIEVVAEHDSDKEACETFRRAKSRLLNPHTWHRLTGSWAATFKLVTVGIPDSDRQARKNDYIRIDIPGPGSIAGEGYDWVRIEEIKTQPDGGADESFALTVRASANPRNPSAGTAHFFQNSATSTFFIKRNGNNVVASYHGRNERPNTNSVKPADKLRNALVASAAMAGISELQWRGFLEGLLK